MAISFPYYFGLTDLSTGIISDAWYEPANVVTGNFALNITGSVNRRLQNTNSDFTLICTIDRLKSLQNSGAVELLAGSGWTFGVDHSNFFFVQSANEAYTFDQINLGRKNCFALTKDGNAFNVTSFNVPSQGVEATQTQFFGPSNSMTGTGLFFAGGNPISGIRYFYGTVDQLVLLNQPISTKNLETLFSGFLQQDVTYGATGQSWALEYISWEQTGGYTSGQIAFLQTGATFFASDSINYFAGASKPNGGYYGEMSITGGATKVETSRIDPTGFINPCTTFGLSGIGSHSMGTGSVSGTATVLINYQMPYSLFSFDFSALKPGMTLDMTYELQTQQSVLIAPNTGYYSGFYMEGVNSPEAVGIILRKYPPPMHDINRLGSLDITSSKYYTPGNKSGNLIYADGLSVSYIQSGDYVTPSISNIDELIYDSITSSSLIPISTGTRNFTTGNFFPKTSVVFSGTGRRTLDYLETHSYHLYHAKTVYSATGETVYANSDINWQ